MNESLKGNALELANKIIDNGLPDKDRSFPVLPVSNLNNVLKLPDLQNVLESLYPKLTKSHKSYVIESRQRALRLVIGNLIRAAFNFSWLSIPVSNRSYTQGSHYQRLGLTRRISEDLIKLLIESDLMIKGRGGYLTGSTGWQPMASQFFPSPKLIRIFAEALYAEFGDFDDLSQESLYQFVEFEHEDIPKLCGYEDKLNIIRNYNQFMKQFSWAMKSPSYRSIKHYVGRSGRIINQFQSLSERRVQIRTNTLLDGEPIIEPDFSANHLRMASALIGEKLPEDPYTVISEQTGATREQTKRVVTECIGASSQRQKGGRISQAFKGSNSMSSDMFKDILSALEAEYTWAKDIFFKDYGTRMQYLEGEIALKMMNWCTHEEIPLLVVHDQYAVKKKHEKLTEEMMNKYWNEVIQEAIKNKFIENTNYTVQLVLDRKKS